MGIKSQSNILTASRPRIHMLRQPVIQFFGEIDNFFRIAPRLDQRKLSLGERGRGVGCVNPKRWRLELAGFAHGLKDCLCPLHETYPS